MKPLTFQIQSASDTAKFMAVRVGGLENERWEDNETTFEQLHERIAKALDFLRKVQPENFAGKEEIEVKVLNRQFTGVTYLTTFAIPNFYFHLTTAYAILRLKGVELGKSDYLGNA